MCLTSTIDEGDQIDVCNTDDSVVSMHKQSGATSEADDKSKRKRFR